MNNDGTKNATGSSRSTKRNPKSGRSRLRPRGAVVLTFCGVCAVVGAFAGNIFWRSPALRSMVFDYFTPTHLAQDIEHRDIFASYSPSLRFPPQYQHSMNLLVLGCDADYYPGKPIPIPTSNGRSDSTMLVHIDFDKNSVDIISIPRDTACNIPGHPGFDKINAAHEWGGNKLTDATIEQDFGVVPDYTVAAHFSSFQKIVNAVGGVDLYVDKPLNYDDNWANLHIHLKPGFQHLTGYQAMGFVRIRHSDSDIMREQRQQEFLEALKHRVESPTNFNALPNVLNAITDNLQSNMTLEQMLSLAHWAASVPKANIHTYIVPTIQGPSFVYTDQDPARKLLAQVLYNGDTNQVHLNLVPPPANLAYVGGATHVSRYRRRYRRRRHLSLHKRVVQPAISPVEQHSQNIAPSPPVS